MAQTTSLERTMAALNHQVPDRVPVALHNFLLACRMIGADFTQALRSGEALAEAQLAAWREFGHDVIMHENGVCAEAEGLGCGIRYQSGFPPHVQDPVLKSLDDVDKLTIPDPEKTFPLNELLKATRIIVRETKGAVFVIGRADIGPIPLASALYGAEKFLLACADEGQRPKVLRLLAFCSRMNIVYGEAHRRAGAHGSSIGVFGCNVISPTMYDQLEFPGDKAFCDAMRAVGCKSFVHACGNETALLENLIRTGADCLELDPGTNATVCKQVVRGRTSVLGMLDIRRILWRATEDEVRRHTLDIMRVMAPGGGFLMGPGCALQADTPVNSIHVVMECARTAGVYDPDGSLPWFN